MSTKSMSSSYFKAYFDEKDEDTGITSKSAIISNKKYKGSYGFDDI